MLLQCLVDIGGHLGGMVPQPDTVPLSRWHPPPFGQYKLNWDVTLDSRTKHLGIGIVVRDHNAFVIAAQGKRMPGFP
jgi:hypothetical protein